MQVQVHVHVLVHVHSLQAAQALGYQACILPPHGPSTTCIIARFVSHHYDFAVEICS